MPKYYNFEESLTNNNIDSDIRGYLSRLSSKYGSRKNLFENEKDINFITGIIDEIERIEQKLQEQKKQEEQARITAIEDARERYNSKSSLCKFLNKKMNPDLIDFNSMTTEQINNLYNEEGEKRGRGK